MDAVGGMLISWLVIRAGWGNTYTSLVELADAGVDAEMKEKVHTTAEKALRIANQTGVEIRRVQGTKAGQSYLLELEIAVPTNYTVSQTQGIEDLVRNRIGERVRGVRRVRIRFVPNELEDVKDEFISPSASARSTPEYEMEENGHVHDHDHEHSHAHGDGTAHSNGNANRISKRR
jgi:divalent metal cation (Fe/Co/Zn/Cd) transporter